MPGSGVHRDNAEPASLQVSDERGSLGLGPGQPCFCFWPLIPCMVLAYARGWPTWIECLSSTPALRPPSSCIAARELPRSLWLGLSLPSGVSRGALLAAPHTFTWSTFPKWRSAPEWMGRKTTTTCKSQVPGPPSPASPLAIVDLHHTRSGSPGKSAMCAYWLRAGGYLSRGVACVLSASETWPSFFFHLPASPWAAVCVCVCAYVCV